MIYAGCNALCLKMAWVRALTASQAQNRAHFTNAQVYKSSMWMVSDYIHVEEDLIDIQPSFHYK